MKLDPRQVKSKQKLHEAYLSLMIEGQDQLSIQQLCAKASVTRPTFYKLYKDVNELRKALIDELLAELKEALTITNPKSLEDITEDEKHETLTLLFQHILKHQVAYETLLIFQTDALFTNGIQDVLKMFVRDGIYFSQTRPFLIDVDEELIVAYVSGAYLECVRWWIKSNYETPPQHMAKTLINISLNGPYVKRLP